MVHEYLWNVIHWVPPSHEIDIILHYYYLHICYDDCFEYKDCFMIPNASLARMKVGKTDDCIYILPRN